MTPDETDKKHVSWEAERSFLRAALICFLLFTATIYYWLLKFLWELDPFW